MKWIVRIVLGFALLLAVIMGIGLVAQFALREEKEALDAAGATVAALIDQEFKLRPQVSYSLQKSALKEGLTKSEAYVQFEMIPPTADMQAIARRTAEIAFEHMPFVTTVHLIGRDPRSPRPYRVSIHRKLSAQPPGAPAAAAAPSP